jgi:hypothetical protein
MCGANIIQSDVKAELCCVLGLAEYLRNMNEALLQNLEHGLILLGFMKVMQAHYRCSREA